MLMHGLKIILCWSFIYLFLAPCSYSKLPTPHPDPLSISLRQKDSHQNQIQFQIKLMDGYKAYIDKFQVKSKYPKKVAFSLLEIKPTIVFYDKFFNKTQKGFVGQGLMSVQFQILKDVDLHTLEGWLIYQACTDEFCLLPKKIPFSLNMTQMQRTNIASRFHQTLEKGVLWAFLFVFIAGFLTSLTPCIFPMIPITLSVLGTQMLEQSRLKQSRLKQSRLEGFILSLCYVFGMGITYALLGVIAATTGSFFGAVLANPLVIFSVVILFILMGLSMYGFFEIQTPQWIQNQLGHKKIKKGFKGVFLAGLISGVVASPCVGPVLIGILTYVSQTQDILLGFLLLFTFAMGLGVLFLLLGTFSQLINYLPKSGPWMDIVKFLFGTTMIVMALYYLNFILEFQYFKATLGLFVITIGIYLYWKVEDKLTRPSQALRKIRTGLSLICYFIGSLLLFTAFWSFDKENITTLKESSFVEDSQKIESKVQTETHWQEFTDQLFQDGLTQSRPMIIDFTAQWCAVCKALKTHTFSHIDVQMEFKKFLLLRVDATTETKDVARWISDFKILGLPTLLFYDKNGSLQEDLTLTNFEEPQAFLQRMKKALN